MQYIFPSFTENSRCINLRLDSKHLQEFMLNQLKIREASLAWIKSFQTTQFKLPLLFFLASVVLFLSSKLIYINTKPQVCHISLLGYTIGYILPSAIGIIFLLLIDDAARGGEASFPRLTPRTGGSKDGLVFSVASVSD